MTTDRRSQGAPGSAVAAPHAFLGLPSHVLVMLAASTAGYALVLAAVTGMQSRAENDLAMARQPALDGVAELRMGHDALTSALETAQGDYNATVAAYVEAGGSLDVLNSKLAVLTSLVGDIDGVSRAMPAAVQLPAVHASVGTVRTPSTQSTTGASGAVK